MGMDKQEIYKNSHNKPIKVDVIFIKKNNKSSINMSCANKYCRQCFIINELFNDNDMIKVLCPECGATTIGRYFSDGNYLWGHLKEGD